MTNMSVRNDPSDEYTEQILTADPYYPHTLRRVVVFG